MKHLINIISVALFFILTSCTTNHYYQDYYLPPLFDKKSVDSTITPLNPNLDSKIYNKLFVYFIASVDDKSISGLIKGIDDIISRNPINEIHLFINSGGGITEDGLAADNYLSNLNINLYTYNLSYTASAATLLYCAGKKRYSTKGSSFLFHNISTNLNHHDMDEIALRVDGMNASKEQMTLIYKSCFKNDQSIVSDIFTKGFHIIAPNDIKIGLSDTTIDHLPRPDKNTLTL